MALAKKSELQSGLIINCRYVPRLRNAALFGLHLQQIQAGEMGKSTLDFAMLPWFAAGHITPYIQLSNRLAARGHRVSFFIPVNTQNKFNHLNLHPHLFHFIPLTLDGLPIGVESMLDVPLNHFTSILKAFDLTQNQVQTALGNLKPDIIFYDFAHWIPPLAKQLEIKSIHFITASALNHSWVIPARFEPKDVEKLVEPPPEYYPGSSSVKPHPYEVKDIENLQTTPGDGMISTLQRLYISMRDSDALCFRACSELEGPFLDYIENQYKKPVYAVGPLLDQPCQGIPLEIRWAEWLEGFEKGSVVYCALGSEFGLSKDEFQELVLGLEMSGFPFLARLKPPTGADTVEEALPEGFQERVKGRGVVHGGWVQQQLILAHPSVGGFVTHCGAGSMWESLKSHAQLVLFPQAFDQHMNSKFLSKGLKVGVEVERRAEDGWFSKEDVCGAVKSVMEAGGQVGEQVRSNHYKWSKFLSSEGLELSYIDNFITKVGRDILQ